MNRSLKVFLACAFGAGIGSLVALDVLHLIWWVELLIGAGIGSLSGYLFYDFGKVISAAKKTHQEVVGWRYEKEYWRAFTWLTGSYVLATLSILATASVIYVIICYCKGDAYFLTLNSKGDWRWLLLTVLVFVLMLPTMIYIGGWPRELLMEDRGGVDWELKRLFILFNPISVFYFVFKFAAWVYGWLFISAFKGIVAAARIMTKTIVLVYLDERLLCAIWAAGGTIVGYFYVNAIVGMLAGGFCGLANYKLINQRFLAPNNSVA